QLTGAGGGARGVADDDVFDAGIARGDGQRVGAGGGGEADGVARIGAGVGKLRRTVVAAGADDVDVVAGAAVDHVGACTAVDHVGARATVDGVDVAAAGQGVDAVVTGQGDTGGVRARIDVELGGARGGAGRVAELGDLDPGVARIDGEGLAGSGGGEPHLVR